MAVMIREIVVEIKNQGSKKQKNLGYTENERFTV